MLRHYEIVLIFKPNATEQAEKLLSKTQQDIKAADGEIHRVESWGELPFVFPIKKEHKGSYFLMNIECVNKTLEDLNKIFYYDEEILRYMILRKKEGCSEPSAMIKKSEPKTEEESKPDDIENRVHKKMNAMLKEQKSRIKRRKYKDEHKLEIDYKNLVKLIEFVSPDGRIVSSRVTGVSAKIQHKLSRAIKRARFLALLKYCDNHKI